MISHKHRIIFIHIPKTGGTSIARSLGGPKRQAKLDNNHYCGWDPTLKVYRQHMTMQELKNNYPDYSSISSYKSFAFVRNPWDRAVSGWLWLNKDLGIRGSLKSYLKKSGPYTQAFVKTKRNWRGEHFRPQSDFVFHDGNRCVDFIGRFESINKDFSKLFPNISLRKSNVTKGREHYSEYFDKETRKLVYEIYGDDINNFKYRFGE